MANVIETEKRMLRYAVSCELNQKEKENLTWDIPLNGLSSYKKHS